MRARLLLAGVVVLGQALTPAAPARAGQVRFVEVSEAAGLHFRHTNGGGGPNPKRYYIETMCGGVAFVDYDGDGHLDVYAVNGQHIDDPGAPRATNGLFRNAGDGTFGDVTAATGAGDEGYGMGVATGDYDGDGHVDIYVTNYGPNVLLRNRSGRSFDDVGQAIGVADRRWGVGAAFLDYDNDGDLDLYVANYLNYQLADADRQLRPYVSRGVEAPAAMGYPHPDNFSGVADVLYRNDGEGFADVTREAGVYDPGGKGMGLVAADYDDDGDVDIFVANDQTANFLYQNRGDGSFAEVGLLSGTAYDANGRTQSGMGAAFGDYDNDGRQDLFLTVYQGETNALYRNEGQGIFSDVGHLAGIALPSLPYVSWGNGFVDYDNDGRRDIFVANGHVLDNAEAFDSSSHFAQPNQLFRNLGPDAAGRWRFADASAAVGLATIVPRPSRGVAFGDYDNDGDADILILNLNEDASLLRNDGGNAQHWLTIHLKGTRSNRDAVGARVRVTAGELAQVQQVAGGGSYLAQSDRRLSFGLGSRRVVDRVEVTWPSGTVEVVPNPPVDAIITVVEGRGLVSPAR